MKAGHVSPTRAARDPLTDSRGDRLPRRQHNELMAQTSFSDDPIPPRRITARSCLSCVRTVMPSASPSPIVGRRRWHPSRQVRRHIRRVASSAGSAHTAVTIIDSPGALSSRIHPSLTTPWLRLAPLRQPRPADRFVPRLVRKPARTQCREATRHQEAIPQGPRIRWSSGVSRDLRSARTKLSRRYVTPSAISRSMIFAHACDLGFCGVAGVGFEPT